MSYFWLDLLRDYSWDKIWAFFSWLTDPLCFGFNCFTSFTEGLSLTRPLARPHRFSSRFANSRRLPASRPLYRVFFPPPSPRVTRSCLSFSLQLTFHFLEEFFDHLIKSRYPLLISTPGHCSGLWDYLPQVINILLVDLVLHAFMDCSFSTKMGASWI